MLKLRAAIVRSFRDVQVNLEQLSSTATLSGIGSPEGTVAAAVGAVYTDRAGGAGSTLYVKETGTGKTGWAAK